DDEVFHRIVMREHQPVRPFRMRLVTTRGIGHGAGEAAHLTAVDDVGDPEDSRQDHRARQPEQFTRHRFPLISISRPDPAGCMLRAERNAQRYARTRTYLPGASSIGGSTSPTCRAGTRSASIVSSHCNQSGHHEPLCSTAPLIHSATEAALMLSLVQYWYLPP